MKKLVFACFHLENENVWFSVLVVSFFYCLDAKFTLTSFNISIEICLFYMCMHKRIRMYILNKSLNLLLPSDMGALSGTSPIFFEILTVG